MTRTDPRRVTAAPAAPYAGGMAQPDMAPPDRDTRAETDRMLAAAGIVVTDEGRGRAREKLAAAQQRMTPQAWARLRERYGRTDAA